MFSIYDGREQFYQWDKDRKLIVEDETITQVHFANCLCPKAQVSNVYPYDDDFGGIRLVNVPNDLLTEYMDIRVWGYDGEMTKHEQVFEVAKRPQPSNYIYTPTEVLSYESLLARVEMLESNAGMSNVIIDEISDSEMMDASAMFPNFYWCKRLDGTFECSFTIPPEVSNYGYKEDEYYLIGEFQLPFNFIVISTDFEGKNEIKVLRQEFPRDWCEVWGKVDMSVEETYWTGEVHIHGKWRDI